MLLINLIAARRAERRRKELIRGALTRGMVFVAVATLFAMAFMSVSMQITRNRIADVDQQTAMLQDTVHQVERLQASMAAIQPRVATLLRAQNAINRWRSVLQEVSTSLAPDTWITSFASRPAPDQGFTITGQTKSQALVGRTMLNMNQQQSIQSVTLAYTQSNANKNNPLMPSVVSFEMAGALHPTEGSDNDK